MSTKFKVTATDEAYSTTRTTVGRIDLPAGRQVFYEIEPKILCYLLARSAISSMDNDMPLIRTPKGNQTKINYVFYCPKPVLAIEKRTGFLHKMATKRGKVH